MSINYGHVLQIGTESPPDLKLFHESNVSEELSHLEFLDARLPACGPLRSQMIRHVGCNAQNWHSVATNATNDLASLEILLPRVSTGLQEREKIRNTRFLRRRLQKIKISRHSPSEIRYGFFVPTSIHQPMSAQSQTARGVFAPRKHLNVTLFCFMLG